MEPLQTMDQCVLGVEMVEMMPVLKAEKLVLLIKHYTSFLISVHGNENIISSWFIAKQSNI